VSDADVERLRRGFEAFARGEHERAFSGLHDDFQVIDHLILEDTSEARGPQALAQNIAELEKAFEHVGYEVLEVIDLDGRIVTRVMAKARAARDGGLETQREVGQLWTLRDGRAVRLEIFGSFQKACDAAGLDR
jgi:ketosteroid isomerase-like protein